MAAPHTSTPTLLALLGALLLAAGCRAQTRIEAVRMGWAHRGGGHWFEMNMPSVEVGPGGARPQSVTLAATARILRGRDDEGRVEGAVQARAHLWRAHRVQNVWTDTGARFNPNDPNLRRVPCGAGSHVQRFDGRAYTETFSVGALVEGWVGGVGSWVPDGLDRYGRPRQTLAGLRPAGGVTAGVFARMLLPYGITLNLDGGASHEDGAFSPYLRAGVGMALDLHVNRREPRIPDEP